MFSFSNDNINLKCNTIKINKIKIIGDATNLNNKTDSSMTGTRHNLKHKKKIIKLKIKIIKKSFQNQNIYNHYH